MNYREKLRAAHKAKISIVDTYVADQVDSSFDDLTDDQFEQVCDIVKFSWDSGYSVDEIVNFISDKTYYLYENNIQLFLDRNSAEEVINKMRS